MCSAEMPPRRWKHCVPCARAIKRETSLAWNRAHGAQPTTRPASDFTGRTRKPRPVCACGKQAARAYARRADGGPYRCHTCARAARPKAPERPCALCGTLFRPTANQRRYCSPAHAAARAEEARDRQRVPVEQKLRVKRVLSRRHSAKRRAAFKAIGASTKPDVGRWRRICVRDGWVCWICKGRIDPSMVPSRHRRAPSVDHIVPVGAPGWSDDDSNVRAAHYGCNSRRQLARL
jgi:hypothetical protein